MYPARMYPARMYQARVAADLFIVDIHVPPGSQAGENEMAFETAQGPDRWR